MRSTAEKRHNDYKKAIRKREIDRDINGASIFFHDWYDNLHQYSKNKIFRNYRQSSKTNNRGNYGPSMNWKLHDRRQLDDLDYEEEEEDN